MIMSSNGKKSVLLAFFEGNPPFTSGFPSQRPVTPSFDVFFDGWANNRDAGDLRRRRTHYDVNVMTYPHLQIDGDHKVKHWNIVNAVIVKCIRELKHWFMKA